MSDLSVQDAVPTSMFPMLDAFLDEGFPTAMMA
jgi:hypothetical protein